MLNNNNNNNDNDKITFQKDSYHIVYLLPKIIDHTDQ